MIQDASQYGLVETYRVARKMHKKEQPPFERIRELRTFAKRAEDPGLRVLANAGMTAVDLIKPSEAFELHALGLYKPIAEGKLGKMRGSESRSNFLEGELHIELEPTVNVYEGGREARLGIPIIGESAVHLAEERDELVDSLFGVHRERDYLEDWSPYLTIGVVACEDERTAQQLSFIAKDLLWSDDNPAQMKTEVLTYAPEVRDAQTRLVVRDTRI